LLHLFIHCKIKLAGVHCNIYSYIAKWNQQGYIATSIHTLQNEISRGTLQYLFIQCKIKSAGYIATSIHTLQHLFICIHLQSTWSIKRRFFGELTSVCQWWRLPCTWGRVAAAAEEKAGSSGVDGGRGYRLERWRWQRRVWDEKRNDTG
jgi:hypothetical protein